MNLLRRAFLGSGLILLAIPGMLAEHVDWWVYPLAGLYAGLLAAAAVGLERKP